jgi:hypothetical protein
VVADVGPGSRFQAAGTAAGWAAMNMLAVLYGFGGMCAITLMAYLMYALWYAEEF